MKPGAFFPAIHRAAVAVVVAALVSPVVAGDRLLIEMRTLSRDDRLLLVVIPDGRMLASETVAQSCVRAAATESDVLEFDLEQGACRVVATGVLDHPLISSGDVPPFDSVGACLSAHFAVLEDATSGLPICFEWFRCVAFSPFIAGPGEVCSGNQVVLDAGADYPTILWSPDGETTRTISVSPFSDTVYSVQVADEWGCEGSADHLVEVRPLPEPTILGPSGVCAGGSVVLELGEPFASYAWSPSGQTTQYIEISPGATTDYSVTVSDTAGCSGTSAVHRVTVFQPPTPVISGPGTMVSGQTAILDGGAGYAAYLWSPGTEPTRTITVSPAATTDYEVTVSDSNACAGTSPVHTLVVMPAEVFADGFETGNTSRWSVEVP